VAAASATAVVVNSFIGVASPVSAGPGRGNDGGALDLERFEAKVLGGRALNVL
jgi:hypothetical protein